MLISVLAGAEYALNREQNLGSYDDSRANWKIVRGSTSGDCESPSRQYLEIVVHRNVTSPNLSLITDHYHCVCFN
jgi:hypothetical protein